MFDRKPNYQAAVARFHSGSRTKTIGSETSRDLLNFYKLMRII